MDKSPLYEFEVWSNSGVLLADISAIATNRQFSMQRNEAETLSFDLDLTKFEQLCASIGTPPRAVIWPYTCDIKVKRNGTYLFGTHVYDATPTFNQNDAILSIKADGYLNFFKDRYLNKTYTQTESTTIAWNAIATTQATTNGNLGITQGANQVAVKVRDRTYQGNTTIKTIIQNLTQLIDGNFDFEFTYDKKFNTYSKLGSSRPEVVLTYGAEGNISEITVPTSASSIFNTYTGLGSGFGDDQLDSFQSDVNSQLSYLRREKITTYNSVVEQTTLDDNTKADLALTKDMLQIPQVTMDGSQFDLGVVKLGDRVKVIIQNHAYVDNINGMYRIEKMDVSLDDNDAETIKLTFDNYGI